MHRAIQVPKTKISEGKISFACNTPNICMIQLNKNQVSFPFAKLFNLFLANLFLMFCFV